MQKPLITARKISDSGVPGKRVGIPYYLPKPYLVVTKNVRYIPALTTGLTEPAAVPDSFDTSAGELKIQGDISQSRSVAVERKIQELEEDKRYTEEKFQRIEEDKKYTEEKLQELKEDKRLIERKVTELTEDKRNLERKIHDLEQRSTTTTISKDPELEAKLEALREELESVKAKLDELAKNSQPNSNPGTAQPTPEIANPQAESGATSATSQATGGATRQVLGLRDVSVVPSGRIEDGLVPETFYTYQIIFLPDMTQRYGLEVFAPDGEFRATMNLVNGWMHTGMGPIYTKNSTTAATVAAQGLATANVIDSLASLGMATGRGAVQGGTGLDPKAFAGLLGAVTPFFAAPQSEVSQDHEQAEIKDFAEIYVFEIISTTDGTSLTPVIQKKFNRDYFKPQPSVNNGRASASHALVSYLNGPNGRAFLAGELDQCGAVASVSGVKFDTATSKLIIEVTGALQPECADRMKDAIQVKATELRLGALPIEIKTPS